MPLYPDRCRQLRLTGGVILCGKYVGKFFFSFFLIHLWVMAFYVYNDDILLTDDQKLHISMSNANEFSQLTFEIETLTSFIFYIQPVIANLKLQHPELASDLPDLMSLCTLYLFSRYGYEL